VEVRIDWRSSIWWGRARWSAFLWEIGPSMLLLLGYLSGCRYVSSVNFDLKSSRVEESDENNHSDAADNFSLNVFRSSSELTFWKRSSSRKSRDR
jgi:hypothetical protein